MLSHPNSSKSTLTKKHDERIDLLFILSSDKLNLNLFILDLIPSVRCHVPMYPSHPLTCSFRCVPKKIEVFRLRFACTVWFCRRDGDDIIRLKPTHSHTYPKMHRYRCIGICYFSRRFLLEHPSPSPCLWFSTLYSSVEYIWNECQMHLLAIENNTDVKWELDET